MSFTYKYLLVLFLSTHLLSNSYAIAFKATPIVTQQLKLTANLQQPSAVAIAENGHIYIVDGTQNRIVVFDATGKLLFTFGQQGEKTLNKPMDVSISGNFIVIADTGSKQLVVYNLQGQLIKQIQVNTDETQKIKPATPISVFINNKIIYWADRSNHRICKTHINSGKLLKCFAGQGATDGLFQYPWQIKQDRDGYLHIVDVLNARVQVFHNRGQFFSQTSRFGTNPGELFRPNGIAIDNKDNIFVSDSYLGQISIFNNGKFISFLKDNNNQTLKFKVPVGIALHNGVLYVVDAANNSVSQLKLTYRKNRTKDNNGTKNQTAELSQKNCVTCHLSWADKRSLKNKPFSDQVLPVASFDMCYSCHHGVILDSRQMIKHNKQHPNIHEHKEEKFSFKKWKAQGDELPKEFPLSHNQEMLCTSCHTPHNSDTQQQTLYTEHNNSWMRISSKDGDLCERCHQSKAKTARELNKKDRGINHPLAIKLEKTPTKNATAYTTNPDLYNGLPDNLKNSLASLSSKNELICQSCHQVHGGYGQDLLAIKKDHNELCKECHQQQYAKDKKEARQKGIHPVNIKLDKPIESNDKEITQVNCDSCHIVHNGQLGTDLLPTQIENTEQLCIECHQQQHAKDKDDAIKKGIHPMNIKLDKAIKIGGKKVQNIGCLSCHSVHNGKKNTPVLLEKYQDGELCKNCHKRKQAIIGTDHDFRITAKDQKNHLDELVKESGVCGSCHSMHRAPKNVPFLYTAKIVKNTNSDKQTRDKALFKRDSLCLNCHQDGGMSEARSVSSFSHPYKDMILRSDKDIMPLLSEDEIINEFGAIACMTCHEVHQWKPLQSNNKPEPSSNQKNIEGNNKTSFLRHSGVKNTFCVDCHGIEALTKYKYYHDKNKVRNIGVDYLK